MHSPRAATIRQASGFLFRLLFWIPVIAFSLLLIYNTIPYFSFRKDFSFIEERSILFSDGLYTASFYLHIFAGAICIGTALLQFSRFILKKLTVLHRWSGRAYVAVVLFLGAPTGLYLSFFAKGTPWERSLFLFMAVWWFITTWYGLSTILRKNVLVHQFWMMRSYAMAMTAVSFRVYHIAFYLLGWGHLENYELSLWISVIGNMLIAEIVVYRKCKLYLSSFHPVAGRRSARRHRKNEMPIPASPQNQITI